MNKTRFLVFAALMTSLTTVSTMVIKVPTPTFGYVHIGDGMVLLSGFILGPLYGALAAGIGSALADLLSGYAMWVPGTFVIKAATAALAAFIYGLFKSRYDNKKIKFTVSVLSSLAGEAIMVIGYFLFNILMVAFINAETSGAGVSAAVTASVAEIPFNCVQGLIGLIIAVILLPITEKLYKNME